MNSRSSILSNRSSIQNIRSTILWWSSNQFAHAACLAVADLPAKITTPSLFMGGGLGKTHLLHAIGYHILQHRILPDMRKVCYLSSEEFTNELINSLRYEKMDEFRINLEGWISSWSMTSNSLPGKRTQAEFFHTFNSLYEARKQSSSPAISFPKISQTLKNVFDLVLNGAWLQTSNPQTLKRSGDFKEESRDGKYFSPQWCAFFLASQIDSNIRILEDPSSELGLLLPWRKQRSTSNWPKKFKNIIKPKEEFVSIDLVQKVVSTFLTSKYRT